MHSAHTDSNPQSATPALEITEPQAAPATRDLLWLSVLAIAASIGAAIYYFHSGQVLLYGDATSHIGIARRIFDSRTPRLGQLGTVWLPLPHLLMVPFVLSTWAWKTGLGGSIPSMAAYVFGVIGLFRLVRGALPPGAPGRVAAWTAAFVYGANPNLLYLQSTAMTEPLYLALFIWATVFFSEFVQATRSTGDEAAERRSRSLTRCALMLSAAMLTRYDGWFTAAVFSLAALAVLWTWTGGRIALWRSPLRPVIARFVLALTIVPLVWFAYNLYHWGNPLEFANGPYSARAIEARAERPGGWHYPGWHVPRTAADYFLKSVKLNMVAAEARVETYSAPRWRLENAWFPLAGLGVLLLLVFARSAWTLLLLWLPLPFYILCIAWGSVPIFLPVWWPYSYYNVRYGLQLLPALAAGVALLVCVIGRRWRPVLVLATVGVVLFASLGYAVSWRAVPVCLREARENSATRIPFDRKIAAALTTLPMGATVLAYTAAHAAAFEFAGYPLRRTVNETDEKLWPAALAAPGSSTDYVLVVEERGDPVWAAIQEHPYDLQVVTTIESPGQPRAVIYRRR